jgi:Ca2+-binding RTX toxin-like protein
MVVDLSRGQVINDGLGFAATVTGFRNAIAAGGDDTITGSAAANGLHGGDGADVLFGGAGNDVLAGDNGADTVTGGSGNDIFAFGLDSEYRSGDVEQGEYGDVITDFVQGQDKLDIQPNLEPLPFFGTTPLDLGRGLATRSAAATPMSMSGTCCSSTACSR